MGSTKSFSSGFLPSAKSVSLPSNTIPSLAERNSVLGLRGFPTPDGDSTYTSAYRKSAISVLGNSASKQAMLASILGNSASKQAMLAAIERHGLPNSTDSTPNSTDSTPGSTPVPSGPSATALDYYNADISKLYGMDKNVAYQEALANTAYQRAVKDMQAAGLNPASLFGAGRASAADGVGYVGASGGYSGGRSSARAQSEFGMSKSDYTKLSGVCTVLGIAAGAVAGHFIPGLSVSSGATLGAMASQGVAKFISQW